MSVLAQQQEWDLERTWYDIHTLPCWFLVAAAILVISASLFRAFSQIRRGPNAQHERRRKEARAYMLAELSDMLGFFAVLSLALLVLFA